MIPPENLKYTIEEIIKKEDETGEERRKIHKCEHNDEDSILNTKKEINEYNKHLIELETELHKAKEDFNKINCKKLNLKIQLDAVKKISVKTFQTYERDVKKTEEIQQSIWNNRIKYCEKVTDFIKNFGIAATLNRNFDLKVRGQMADALCDTDALRKIDNNKQSEELTSNTSEHTEILLKLQCKIKNEKLLDSEIVQELRNVLIENEHLEKDYHGGKEFIRLRNAHKYLRDEIFCLQEELRKIEVEKSDRIDNGSTFDRSHEKSHDFKQASVTNSFELPQDVEMKLQEYTEDFPDVPSTNLGWSFSMNKDCGEGASSTANMIPWSVNYSTDYTQRVNGPTNTEFQSDHTRRLDVYKQIETIKNKTIKKQQKTIFKFAKSKKISK